MPSSLDLNCKAPRLIVVKRRDLEREIRAIAKAKGLVAEFTEGGKHTHVRLGDKQTTIPRNNEINEHTARGILRHLGAAT